VTSLHKVWKDEHISKTTKVLLYQTLVQSIILYNAETWTLKEEEKQKLKVFEMSLWRKISGISGITRRDRRRNLDILKELSIKKDIVKVLQIRRLKYFGHVKQIEKDRFPHILLHGYTHGHRRKKWMDNVREDCATRNMTLQEATQQAKNKTSWRNTVLKMGCWSVRTLSYSPEP